jgi:hypothetical protein
MATIGRSRAVAVLGRLQLTGFVAWLAWLALHSFYLIGFRDRMVVMLDWARAYFGLSPRPTPDHGPSPATRNTHRHGDGRGEHRSRNDESAELRSQSRAWSGQIDGAAVRSGSV